MCYQWGAWVSHVSNDVMRDMVSPRMSHLRRVCSNVARRWRRMQRVWKLKEMPVCSATVKAWTSAEGCRQCIVVWRTR